MGDLNPRPLPCETDSALSPGANRSKIKAKVDARGGRNDFRPRMAVAAQETGLETRLALDFRLTVLQPNLACHIGMEDDVRILLSTNCLSL